MENQGIHRTWRTEPLLGGLALMLLLGGCFFVLRPFMTALMWAIILTYSLYPLQRVFTRWFRGSRTLAACFVTLTVVVFLTGPVVLIGMSLKEDGRQLALATRDWFMTVPNKPPSWVAEMPMVGDDVKFYWMSFADSRNRWIAHLDKEVTTTPAEPLHADGDAEQKPTRKPRDTAKDEIKSRDDSPQLVVLLGRFLTWARSWLISAGLAVGQAVAQVLLSAFFAFFFLRNAGELSQRLAVSVERLAGERGRHLIKVAGDTVRGVIYGILGTAIVQAVVAGIGFWIAGVPGAVLLAVLTFFLAVVPVGPPMVWIPAALWLFAQDRPAYGIFMLIWGALGVSSVDNFVRPYLISQGSKTPFVLIFCGVVGGVLAFGFVGVFLGPTLLAIAFRLVKEWSAAPAAPSADLLVDDISPLPEVAGSATSPSHGGESLGVG